MAIASGPAGPVLAGPVLTITFTPAHAQGSLGVCRAGLRDTSINYYNQQLQRYELVSHAIAAPNVTGVVRRGLDHTHRPDHFKSACYGLSVLLLELKILLLYM